MGNAFLAVACLVVLVAVVSAPSGRAEEDAPEPPGPPLVELPKLRKPLRPGAFSIEVVVDSASRIWVGDRRIDWAGLAAALGKAEAGDMLVRGDVRAWFADVLVVSWMCAEAFPAQDVYWAVAGDSGAAWAPDLWAVKGGGFVVPMGLDVVRNGSRTDLATSDGPIGSLPPAGKLKALRANLEEYREFADTEHAAISVKGGVTHGDVVAVVDACRRTGFTAIWFGRPPLPLDASPARPDDGGPAGDLPIEAIRSSMTLAETALTANPSASEEGLVEVLVTADRRVFPGGFFASPGLLGQFLKDQAAKKTEKPEGWDFEVSAVPVRIRADARALWSDVREVLSGCAEARIHRIVWELRSAGRAGSLSVPLHPASWIEFSSSSEPPVTVDLILHRNRGGARTRVILGRNDLGTVGDAANALAQRLRAARKQEKPVHAVVDVRDPVPFAEVVQILGHLRSGGADYVHFALVYPPD